ncbi:MAG: aldolase, partial [Chloroflexota bacterium]
KYADERKAGETDEQFYYKTRKKAFGDFKKELWGLPEKIQGKIGEALEERFALLFHKLNAVNTVDLVKKYVKV